jgi:pro-apoptotic serine protease NMA111
MFKISITLLCLFLALNAKADENSSWSRTVKKVADSVVTLRIDATRAFDTGTNSSSQATGFVVDAKRGLILTNRHVVQSGPVMALALFSNREEVELTPVYRDPVHDFGFFKYNPDDLKFIKPRSLKLKPEKAKVGSEIRIVGNDAGEQLSILAGTLARLDRSAPNYGRGRYNDFNTFYYQSASGVSGGSSGSPVIDIKGDVLALNAGGSVKAASSFFLPLERIKRVLKLLQQGKPVSRGTLQTTLSYKPYDEVRRLGLRAEIEVQLRKVNHGVGLLVVQISVPEGPGYGVLQSGDILLKGGVSKKKLKWIRRFDEYESLIDSNVDKTVHLLIERNGKPVNVELKVQDLHTITPDEYIEFGGAIVHDLSYQQARHLNRSITGVYVAQSGFVFSSSGIPRGAVILKVGDKNIHNIDDFEKVVSSLESGQQVAVHFITFKESKRMHVSIMNMGRHWFAMKRCKRDDIKGYWPCKSLQSNTSVSVPEIAKVNFIKYRDRRAEKLSSSIVYVQFDLPYHVNGIQEAHYGGAGLIIDAKEGLVLVDKNTVPVAMGDVRVVFAGAVDIPGQVLFVHPLHNMAVVKYDPALLGDTEVESATLKNRKFEQGDEVWLVGIKSDHSLLVEKMNVASIESLEFSIPQTPKFRESNLDVISLNNAPFSRGGVLTDEKGRVISLWSSFSYGSGDEYKQFEWGVPIDLVEELLEQWRCCKVFKFKSLEVELSTLTIAQARKLGLKNEWVEKLQDTENKRQVLAVSRRVGGSDAYKKLKEGDLLLAIDGQTVYNFRDVERATQKDKVELSIVRSAKEIKIIVNTADLSGQGTERALQWAGALIQNPHRAIAAQRGIAPEGVYVSSAWRGSPASRYGLRAVLRITEIENEKISNLEKFIKLSKKYRDKKYIRIKVKDLIDREGVITLKQDFRYWPTREIYRENGEWNSRQLD